MTTHGRVRVAVASAAAVTLLCMAPPAGAAPAQMHSGSAVAAAPSPALRSTLSATRRSTRPPVLGIAQLGKRLPVTGGRVRVRTMSGKRIKVRGMLRTHRSGFFAIASNRLPRRFVVQISGGRVKTRAGGRRVATGRLQALVRRRSPATVTLAHVTFGTTVQARVKRRSGGSKSSARKRTLRAMRLPSYVSLGVDDRVNPRYVQKSVVRRLVRKYHGIPGLSKRVTKLALTGGSLRLSHLKQRPARVPVRAGRVRAQEVDESCLSVLGDFDPASLATCLGSSALAVAEAISGGNQQAQVIDALGSISADLQNVSTQVSDLQADLNDDFLEMMATQAQDQYDDAAAAANALVGEIAADFDQLTTIAAADPTNPNFNAFVYGRSIATLAGALDPDNQQSVLNQITTLQLDTVATGTQGQGTMPAAWAAIRASQPLDGSSALQTGTTLYTSEMSTAIITAGDYWFNVMWQLAVLTANYETYDAAAGAVPDSDDYAATESVLGQTTAQGTCADAQVQPPCPGSISYFLKEQSHAIPDAVPAGMVIDPSTDLVWASAGPDVYQASYAGDYWPQVTPSCGTLALVPDLLDAVNSAANVPDPEPDPTCAWPDVNPGLAEVEGLTGQWQLPTINFGTCQCSNPPYDPGNSPQFGAMGSGTGLLGNITTGNTQTLVTVTDPSPFSLSADAWFQPSPSTWGYSNWFGAGSGLIEFLGPGTGQIIPYPTAGSGQLMGPTGVWLNAPITGDDYGYTPPPSPTD